LLVELPSWPRAFFANLRETVAPRRLPPLEIRSAPAAFWPDVFVQRGLPWSGFAQSSLTHFVALALLIIFTRLLALEPHAQPVPAFQHAQVIYYSPAEYLPPLDTRATEDAQPRKAHPEFSKQAIISVPPEHDNRTQTIVTPPKIRLKQDVALPNIVAWSDTPQKPQLAIPAVPLTPAAEIQRLAPALNSVVAPPQKDVERTLLSANDPRRAPQPAVIAPPPGMEVSSRPMGELNIGRSAVIAPAPSLAVAEQRVVPGGRALNAQVVPPPPSVSSGAAGAAFGAPGRIIALNLHPAIGAPPDPPAGNRRGSFAATPEGHSGATGDPGSVGHGGKENGKGSAGHAGDLPTGLYVGPATGKTATVAGDPNATKAAANSINPHLAASTAPPRVATSAKPLQPDNAAKLSEPERAVFGNRKFYSVSLNMPNLNSSGGSWVIRFAELGAESNGDAAKAPPADLSQPMATHKVDPAYPLQLMKENVAGTVVLYAVIHADGSVGNVRVLRGVDDRLDRFASQAVAQWKFQPATKAGIPVDVEATFRIPFRPTINF
jgi:TonB family protein